MTSIKLIVTGAAIRAEVDGVLTSGMVGIPVKIEYDSSWDGLTKNLICKSRFGICMVTGVEDSATVPHEVMSASGNMCSWENLYIGVEGRNAEGTLVIPTLWAECGTIYPGANSNADPSIDPTLPVWAQLQADVEQLKQSGGEADPAEVQKIVEEYLEDHLPETGADGVGITSVTVEEV